MIRRVIAIVAGVVISLSLAGCLGSSSRAVANVDVPQGRNFDEFLRRDLRSYFSDSLGTTVTVDYDLLRKGPTQAGVAAPKFYLWVRITPQGGVPTQGAVRIAAFEQEGFDVTDFMPAADIRRKPSAVEEVFPAALADGIRKRASTGN